MSIAIYLKSRAHTRKQYSRGRVCFGERAFFLFDSHFDGVARVLKICVHLQETASPNEDVFVYLF